MLVLKVPIGFLNQRKIENRFAGCTVSLKNEGNSTLVMVYGLKMHLDIHQELQFIETCRISIPQSSPKQIHIQPAPKQDHIQPAPKQGHIQPTPKQGHISSKQPILSQGAWLCSKSNNGT